MTKLLSILLALILCLGTLVSCGDEESSSSESSSHTAGDGSFSTGIIEKEMNYYQSLIQLSFEDPYLDYFKTGGEFYTLIRTYDEFLQARVNFGVEEHYFDHETKENLLSPSFFEEYHLIEVCRLSGSSTRISDIIGLKNASFENGILHISKDEAEYSKMYASDVISIGCRYFAIPKSELNLDGVTVDKIEVEENLIYLEDDFYRAVTSEIKPQHGERLVITTPQEYDELKTKYGLTASLVTNDTGSQLIDEDSVYIAIYYGERAEDALSRGYHLETDGNKIILTEYVNSGIENPLYSAPYFKFIKIKKSDLGIEPNEISKIIVKEIFAAPKLEIAEQTPN